MKEWQHHGIVELNSTIEYIQRTEQIMRAFKEDILTAKISETRIVPENSPHTIFWNGEKTSLSVNIPAGYYEYTAGKAGTLGWHKPIKELACPAYKHGPVTHLELNLLRILADAHGNKNQRHLPTYLSNIIDDALLYGRIYGYPVLEKTRDNGLLSQLEKCPLIPLQNSYEVDGEKCLKIWSSDRVKPLMLLYNPKGTRLVLEEDKMLTKFISNADILRIRKDKSTNQVTSVDTGVHRKDNWVYFIEENKENVKVEPMGASVFFELARWLPVKKALIE